MKQAIVILTAILFVGSGVAACSQNPDSSSPQKPEVAAPQSAQPAPPQTTAPVPSPKPEAVAAPNPELAAIKPFWVAHFNPSFLTPMVQYDKGRWSKPWPVDISIDPMVPFNELPFVKNLPSLDKVPSAWVGASPGIMTWLGITPTGQPMMLKAEKLVAYESGGEEGYASVTIELAKKADVAQEMKKLGFESGVATNVEAALFFIVRFEPVLGKSEAWNTLRDFLQPLLLDKFKQYEDRKHEKMEWHAEQMRNSVSGETFFFFHAEMKYFPSGEECPYGAELSGWIRQDKAGKLFLIGQESGGYDCEKSRYIYYPLIGINLPGVTVFVLGDGNWPGFYMYEFIQSGTQVRKVRYE